MMADLTRLYCNTIDKQHQKLAPLSHKHPYNIITLIIMIAIPLKPKYNCGSRSRNLEMCGEYERSDQSLALEARETGHQHCSLVGLVKKRTYSKKICNFMKVSGIVYLTTLSSNNLLNWKQYWVEGLQE